MRILHFIGAILVLFATPALAKEGPSAWILAQKSGDVRVFKNGLQPASVQVREALSPGDIIATGANGRAMLTRGGDYVVVAPGSRLLLPQEQKQTGFTRLIQQVGTLLYKVRHTGVPHFAVETPMLAAVVKGTSFTVVVDQDRAAVQVTEGLVEVSSLSGESRRLVERGITVYVGRERPNEIIEMKPGMALPSSGESGDAVKIESSGDVSLATITNLTDGLVREAIQSGPAAPTLNTTATIVPSVTEPVAGVAEATIPAVTQPVVDTVETTVPTITEPVVDIVETTVPTITEPVVEIVETTVPTVTDPIVEIVEGTMPIFDLLDGDNSGPSGSDNSGPSDNSGSSGSGNSGPSDNSGSSGSGNSGPGVSII